MTGVEISFDDKAYLRPGTDVGFRETNSGSIFQVADEEKQRKLPLHDFPVNKVYVTPSSFRVMKWKVESINGIDNLVRTEDQSLVTVRPKCYVGSSGSVLASELLRIYYEEPRLFEVNDGSCKLSKDAKSFALQIRDCMMYFTETTVSEDVTELFESKQKISYELKRLNALENRLHLAELKWIGIKDTQNAYDIAHVNELLDVCCFIREQKKLLIDILLAEQNYEGNIIEKYSPIIHSAKELLALIDKLQLPSFCSIVSELTDAGPGVGVNNRGTLMYLRYHDTVQFLKRYFVNLSQISLILRYQ